MSFNELKERYMRQPREVAIETLAQCNAACVFCPYPTLTRKGARLSMDIITHLIGQMRQWREPFFISPFKVNEPLLDTRLEAICAGIEMEVPAARLRLFTNGHPLTDANIEWIAGLKRVEHLWISLNSTDPQEYGELMKCNFSSVEKRLDALHAAVRRGDFYHPVVVSRVVQGEAGRFDDNDAKFHRRVLARWPRFQSYLIKRDGWLGYVAPGDPRVPRQPCSRWFELSIDATGTASLCCMDGKGDFPQGSVHSESLLDIYNNSFLTSCREAATREGITPCQQCSY